MLTLVLEHAPCAQSVTSRSYAGGQLEIGRGDDCDWRLDDPEQFVSRKHCIITDQSGAISVIDASSGGVFVDGSDVPLGTGNEIPLAHQMRLRLGDFVIRVDLDAQTESETSNAQASEKSENGFDFGRTPPDALGEPKERPKDLPDPFGLRPGAAASAKVPEKDAKPPRPFAQSDPFELDLIKSDHNETPSRAPTSGSGYFGATAKTPASSDPSPPPPVEPALQPALDIAPQPPHPAATHDGHQQMMDALFKGLGLDRTQSAADTPEAMEALGARFRDLVDGLMFLLRSRAKEKRNIRAAQTVIANADVNPLKFLANTDEAMLALILGRNDSYLSGEKAVPAAYRDLADHQVRTWDALQTALRGMIDRFDPEEVERDLAETGLLEQLVAGGRSAKMWQLYQERYQDIAQAAEKRFLGEVGADFRNAYENKNENAKERD